MPNTFSDIMDFHPDNLCVYEEIRANLSALIPFVGAGLVADIYGTWGSALKELGGKLTDSKALKTFKSLIDNGEYFDAAEYLQERRGASNFIHDLTNHFSPNKLDSKWEKITTGPIWMLPSLFTGPILTTNFDQAIERVYRTQGYVGFEVLDPFSRELREQTVRFMNEACVFKMHGTVVGPMADYSRIVFTKTQYSEQYGPKGKARESLQDFLNRRSLIFLGCSLIDDATVNILKETAGPGVAHYAIISCKYDERDARVRALADLNIRAIVYEDGRYDSVTSILKRLLGELHPDALRTLYNATDVPSVLTADEIDFVQRINAELEEQKRYHPSFLLMNGPAERTLLPKAKPIPNARRLAIVDEEEQVLLSEVFRKSWDSSEQTHLFITGRGGVGKTVALLTFATEENFLPKDVPAIYISLYDLSQYYAKGRDCVDEYLQHTFSDEECKTIDDFSRKLPHGSPNLILLLDGYNEIPADRRNDIDKGILKWAKRIGTQVVTTSRIPGLMSLANTRRVELLGLSKEEVQTYLLGQRATLPDNNSNLWQILETPLMLRLYVDSETFSSNMFSPFVRLLRSDNAGGLVWNYLQRELWRIVEWNVGDFHKSYYSAALFLILPYVCWCMESSNEYRITDTQLNYYVRGACRFWLHEQKPSSFNLMERHFRGHIDDAQLDDLADSQLAILSEEAGLLKWDTNGFSLLHQSLRDGLAAIHLLNIMEIPYVSVPKAFGKPISKYVKDFLADMCEKALLLDLWEANRKELPTNRIATHNLLGVISRKYGGDLKMLDWSGMELRGTPLFAFRKGARMEVSAIAASFESTALDISCFEDSELTDEVSSVCFSSDGRLLASGMERGPVLLWEIDTGSRVQKLDCRGGSRVVQFSPDGAELVVSTSGAIQLWDTVTGLLKHELTHRDSNAQCWDNRVKGTNRYTASADYLATECNGEVGLWDPVSGSMIRLIECGRDGVSTSCVSPDGMSLAIGFNNGLVQIWSVYTARKVMELHSCEQTVQSISFTSDGKLLAIGCFEGSTYGDNYGTIVLWDLSTGEVKRKSAGYSVGKVYSVAFSPDDTRLAVGSRGEVHLWNANIDDRFYTYYKSLSINDSFHQVRSVQFTQDGRLIAAGCSNGTVRIWDSATLQCVREFGNKVECTHYTSNYDLSVKHEGGGIWIYDGINDDIVEISEDAKTRIRAISYSPNGFILAGGSSDGSVLLWDQKTGRLLNRFENSSKSIESICFSPDASHIVCGFSDGLIRQFDLKSGLVKCEFAGHDVKRIRAVCFSPDGSVLVSSSDDKTVLLWDSSTGTNIRTIAKLEEAVASVSFSNDGELLAMSSGDNIQLWKTETGKRVRTLRGHTDLVRSVSFSPDGRSLVSGAEDGTTRIWDVKTGRLLRTLESKSRLGLYRTNKVTSVQFSPDGCLIASGLIKGSVELWGTGGDIVTVLEGYSRTLTAVSSICFSPDGLALAVSYWNGKVRLWDVSSQEADKSFDGITDKHYVGTIEPLYGIDLVGLDFSRAIIHSKRDRTILYQNGVIL